MLNWPSLLCAFGAVFFLSSTPAAAQRTHGGMYTVERLQNTLNNAANDSWVRSARQSAIQQAAPWLSKSDERLWSMIPAQSLPRCIDVSWDYNYPNNLTLGCLNCGDEIYKHGNYPYTPAYETKPWKLTCPNCAVVFPTNDFGAYYASGINNKGEFDPSVADRSLLFNTQYPDPAHPLHKYGVDDGYGYRDVNGRYHKFIGYYTWQYWRYLIGGVTRLADAYIYTGDKNYAHKAAIMLDRIADVYPAMDWAPYANRGWYHSDGGSRRGKIEGRIWENSQIQGLARAYDKIISGTQNNPLLYNFLAQKAQQFTLPGNKGTRTDLVNNVDTNLLRTGAVAIQQQRIWGNQGMHQLSMAIVAVSLNTAPDTASYIDWIFSPTGGRLPTMLVDLFDRDGAANESAPHYNNLWPNQVRVIMDVLEPYEGYDRVKISRDYPFIKNIFTLPWHVQLLGRFSPNIGDTGETGLISPHFTAATVADGFKYFNDTAAARYAWERNGNSARNLLMDPGAPTPDHYNKLLEQAALAFPEEQRLGKHLAGYGLASLEFGSGNDGRALWCYYGRSTGHGHLDRLNYSIFAFNTDLTPEMGYPAFASASYRPRAAWTNNTLSHNTVIVNKSPQTRNWTGHPQFYVTSPGFGAFEIESKNAYSQTSVYARTMAFIDTEDGQNSYALDVFRVSGGNDHLLSFHGPPGVVTTSGGNFVNQPTGTYAGPHVSFAEEGSGIPLGYSYLDNVSRATAPPRHMWMDWKAQTGYRGVKATDNIHLRLHLASDVNDIALADGRPPINKPGNPERIRYALLHRSTGSGSSLDSTFVSVAEPWKDTPFINSVIRAEPADPSQTNVAAVKIHMKNGVTDHIISNPDRQMVQIVGGPRTDAAFAWARTVNGSLTKVRYVRGETLEFNGITVDGDSEVTGSIFNFERDPTNPTRAWVIVTGGDARAMKGTQIYVQNDGVRTGVYDVLDVQPDGANWRLLCGRGTFVRGFNNANNYDSGYKYNISVGNSFYAPLTTSADLPLSSVESALDY